MKNRIERSKEGERGKGKRGAKEKGWVLVLFGRGHVLKRMGVLGKGGCGGVEGVFLVSFVGGMLRRNGWRNAFQQRG